MAKVIDKCNVCFKPFDPTKWDIVRSYSDGSKEYRLTCRACRKANKKAKIEGVEINHIDKQHTPKIETIPIQIESKSVSKEIFTKNEIIALKKIAAASDDFLLLLVNNHSEFVNNSLLTIPNKFRTENHNRQRMSYNVNFELINWLRTYSVQEGCSMSDIVNQILGDRYEQIINEFGKEYKNKPSDD
jgi:hypothetical protein